jgi:uncharacterized phage-like protein YoqJ
MKNRTVCFTGHRPTKLKSPFVEDSQYIIDIKIKLQNHIVSSIESGFTQFVSGAAMGVDIWASEIVLSLKKYYPQITLTHVIPHPKQSDRWPSNWQERYQKIIQNGDNLITITNSYYRFCEIDRNQKMVDMSTRIIAVFNGESGGTKRTISYARSNGVEVEVIEV